MKKNNFDDYFSLRLFLFLLKMQQRVILRGLLSQMGQGEEQGFFVSCMQDLMEQ